jgi:hypothetical protein
MWTRGLVGGELTRAVAAGTELASAHGAAWDGAVVLGHGLATH